MAKAGGNSSKFGRNRIKCERYKAAGRREKNKARKAAKLAKRLSRFEDRFDNYDTSFTPDQNARIGNRCSFGTFKKRKARDHNRRVAAEGGLTLTQLHEIRQDHSVIADEALKRAATELGMDLSGVVANA